MDNIYTPRDFQIIERQFGNEDIRIFNVFDLHIGEMTFQYDAWCAFKELISKTANTYLILGGDLMTNTIKSSVGSVFTQAMRPSEQKKWLVKELEPLRDKILCATRGNHEGRNKDDDTDPMYDVMSKLELEDIYHENLCIVVLRFGKASGGGTRNPTYTLAVHHGSGGGKQTGSAINNAEAFAMIFDGIDGLCVGHTHKAFNTFPCKIKIDNHNRKISFKPYFTFSAVSWMDYADYAIRAQMRPASTARQLTQTLLLHGNYKGAELINNIKY